MGWLLWSLAVLTWTALGFLATARTYRTGSLTGDVRASWKDLREASRDNPWAPLFVTIVLLLWPVFLRIEQRARADNLDHPPRRGDEKSCKDGECR